MAIPPGPGQPNPGQQTPGAFHPAGFPTGTIPRGSALSRPTRYPRPPLGRNALIFARVMLGIQAVLWTLNLLTAPLALFQKPLPPGVTSPYGDLQSPSLTRNIITLLVSVAIAACTVTTTFRLAPARRRMWWLALATQAALAALYSWLFTRMAVAPSPEGMASFVAVTIGPVVVAIPLIGLAALLLPSARAAALDRQSRSSPQ